MPRAAACPDVRQYQQLAAGRLSAAEKESLLLHLESCEACARRLSALPEPDTLVELVRQAQTAADPSAIPTIARLVAVLSKLRPDAPALESAATLSQALPAAALKQTRGDVPSSEAAGNRYDFLAPAQAPDELGRLGPYRVLAMLGAGGMGVVFRAEDPQLARLVAVKAMLPTLAASDSARQRFLREARAAAALKHDHIVTIHHVGEECGVPFLAMEFLDGEPLDVRLQREGKLPLADVLRIGRETALGLAAAHKRGLIHRDIKPANLWLEADTGRVKILDFGLARTSGVEVQLTQQGVILGTPAYMAPEQAQGKEVDARCDLFSLGCVLYRMVTGAQPFCGTDVISTLLAVATQAPPPPHALDPNVAPALSALIMRLLAKDPAKRPASAQAVAQALQECAAAAPAPRPKRRRAALAGAVLLAGLVLLWAGGVLRLTTPEGTIVLAGLPADAEVSVDGQTARIEYGPERQWLEVRAAPGERLLQIKAGGFEIKTQHATFRAGERQPLEIRLEPLAAAPARPAGLPPTYKNRLAMEFVLVPRGRSWLGGGGGTPGEREVEIGYDFYLGKYEVTREEWQELMGATTFWFSRTGGGKDMVKDVPDAELRRFPADGISWEQAERFVARLNARAKEAGWVYRLPSETEWEYACRGGPLADRPESAFDFYLATPTTTLLPALANYKHETSLQRISRVGSYPPNRLGLHDMHGNVFESCAGEPRPEAGETPYAVRGGSWLVGANACRASTRAYRGAAQAFIAQGLRVARAPVGRGATLLADQSRRAAQWALSRGGMLGIRLQGEERTIAAGGQLPTEDFLLERLVVEQPVRTAELACLHGLASLHSLHLNGPGIDDAGCALVASLSNVSDLTLWGTGMTQLGLTHVGKMSELTSLALHGNKGVTDAALVPLKSLSKLEALDLNATRVTDAGMAHLRALPRLSQLNLMNLAVTHAGLAELERLKLRHLNLAYSKTGDRDLAAFETWTSLESLLLAGTKVTDQGLVHLTGLAGLQRLWLSDMAIGDPGLKQVARLSRLTDLNLDNTRVSDGGLEDLLKLKNLQVLRLAKTRISAASFARLRQAFAGADLTWSEVASGSGR